MPNCTVNPCPYNGECQDCVHKVARKNKKTGLDTSNYREYKKIWMQRWRAEQKAKERVGVA